MIRTRKSLRWKSLEAKINKRRASVAGTGRRTPGKGNAQGSFSAARLLDTSLGNSGGSSFGSFTTAGDGDDTSSDGSDGEGNSLVIPARSGGIVASPINHNIQFSSSFSVSTSPTEEEAAVVVGGGPQHRLPAITSPISRRLVDQDRARDITAQAEQQTAVQREQQRRQHAALLASLRGQTFATTFAQGGGGTSDGVGDGGFIRAAAAAVAPHQRSASSPRLSPLRAGQRRQPNANLPQAHANGGAAADTGGGIVVPASVGAMRDFMALPRSSGAAAARQYFASQQRRSQQQREASRVPPQSLQQSTSGMGGGGGAAAGGGGGVGNGAAVAAGGRRHDAHDDGAALARSKVRAGEWACKACTFINAAIIEMCEMCETPRPGGRLAGTLSSSATSSHTMPTGDEPLHHGSVRRAASLDSALPYQSPNSNGAAHSSHAAVVSPGQIPAVQLHGATPTSLFFLWSPPVADGGAPIVGYVLEARATGNGGAGGGNGQPAEAWRRLYFGIAANYLATNLSPDTEYAVRVAAINSEGLQVRTIRTGVVLSSALKCCSTDCVSALVTLYSGGTKSTPAVLMVMMVLVMLLLSDPSSQNYDQAIFSPPMAHCTLDDPTAESGFEIPPLRVWGLWAEYWDPPNSCCYYYNRQTRASSWDIPPGMKAALDTEDRQEEGLRGGQKTSFKMKRSVCVRVRARARVCVSVEA